MDGPPAHPLRAASSLRSRAPHPALRCDEPASGGPGRRGIRKWALGGLVAAALLEVTGLTGSGSVLARSRGGERGPVAPAAAYGFPEMHAAWLTGSYWRGRPWRTGWYRAASAGWSVPGLAPAAAVVAGVNAALARGQVVIAVPGTGLWLNVASVEALPNGRISFHYSSGAEFRRGVGECQVGQIDARPAVGLEPHVLHAACVVAFGPGG